MYNPVTQREKQCNTDTVPFSSLHLSGGTVMQSAAASSLQFHKVPRTVQRTVYVLSHSSQYPRRQALWFPVSLWHKKNGFTMLQLTKGRAGIQTQVWLLQTKQLQKAVHCGPSHTPACGQAGRQTPGITESRQGEFSFERFSSPSYSPLTKPLLWEAFTHHSLPEVELIQLSLQRISEHICLN